MNIDYDNSSIPELINYFKEEEISLSNVINKNIIDVENLINECTKRIINQNNIFLLGAGTSGRLAVIEAAELLPTYGDSTFKGIIAGGLEAMENSIEKSEDSLTESMKILNMNNIHNDDLVIGISSSGTTPYTISALNYCKSKKIQSCLISNTTKSKYDININLGVKTEKILDSTRMLSGTLTKQLLNLVTTISMIKSGKTYKNFMISVKPFNNKLINRSIEIIAEITNLNTKKSEELFYKSGKNIKVAIVSYLKNMSFSESQALLDKNKGFLNRII
jgi:N-acetylmuramic acid 6-phosphate etherase